MSDLSTKPPDTIEPSQISELIPRPTLSPSCETVFAGGNWYW